jgi:hypothetical protein
VFRVFSCGRGGKKDRIQMTQQEAFQADSKTKAGAEAEAGAALDVFFHPPERLLNDASLPKPHFHSIQEYRDLHRLSISDPKEFWSKVALFSLFLSFLSLSLLSLFSLSFLSSLSSLFSLSFSLRFSLLFLSSLSLFSLRSLQQKY